MGRKARQWQKNSSSTQAIQNFLASNLNSEDPEHSIHLRTLLNTLSRIGDHRYCPSQLDCCKLYRWKLEVKFDENESITTHINRSRDQIFGMNGPAQQALPQGFRFVLQLQGLEGSWNDWLFVKKSNLPNAGNGLFASRRFSKNCIIGYYCGEFIKTISYDEKKEKFAYCKEDSTSVNLSMATDMYMGMQFLNSVSLEKEANHVKPNVDIGPAGCVTAKMDISQGSELLFSFFKDDPPSSDSHKRSLHGGCKSLDPFLSSILVDVRNATEVFSLFQTIGVHGESNILDFVFVYEVPSDPKAKFSNKVLKDEGLSHRRWHQIATIYVAFPTTYQIGVAKLLALPHGQVPLKTLLCSLTEYYFKHPNSQLRAQFIGKEGTFSDHNFYVKSSATPLPAGPWDLLANCLPIISRFKSNNPATSTMRQSDFVDVGFCSGCNVRRDLSSPFGLSAPRLLEHTLDEAFVNLVSSMVDCQRYAQENTNLFSLDANNSERHCLFASRLGPGNRFEAFRLHRTTVSNGEIKTCGYHCDNHNSQQWPCTLWVARVFGGNRTGIVAYTRKSVDEFFLRLQGPRVYLEPLRGIIRTYGEENRQFNEKTIQAASIFDLPPTINLI